MKFYILESWSIHNMQDDILDYYEVYKSLDDINILGGYVTNDHDFIKAMNRDGGCYYLKEYEL